MKCFKWLSLIMTLTFSGCKKHDDPVVTQPVFQRLLKTETLNSKLVKGSVRYAVLLPDGYDKSTDTYPVVYLLHGYGDTETAWYSGSGGNIEYYVDQNIATTVPMIYIMPFASNHYYVNRYNGSYPQMDMITKELVPAIDSIYRTKKDKSQRAVMGYSMGGYGALVLPALNPEVFSISVPLSMSFRTDEQYENESQDAFNVQWGPNFGGTGLTGAARLNDYFIAHSPFHFFEDADLSSYKEVKYLIDCGDDEEQLQNTNDALHVLMRDRGIPHEYRVRDGGHSWDYWKKSLKEALVFISDAVQNVSYPQNPDPAPTGTLITTADYQSLPITGLGMNVNVMTPVAYATTTADYPVIYFIHQTEQGNHDANLISLFSILRNAMMAGSVTQSTVVEIPVADAVLDSTALNTIIANVENSFRCKSAKISRVLAGNGAGGAWASSIVSQGSEKFNGCYLYNASLPDESSNVSKDVFFYLDATTSTAGYRGYHNAFVALHDQDLGYQYRVRQGDDSYQSVLDGVAQSVFYIKSYLKN